MQGTGTYCIWRDKTREREFGILGSQDMKSEAALMPGSSPGKEMLFTMALVNLALICSFPPFCLTLRVTPALHVLPMFCTKPAQPKCSVTPPGCLWESLKIPPHYYSLQLHLLPGIGRT